MTANPRLSARATTIVDPWLEMLNEHPLLQSNLLEFRHMLESQAAYLVAERATDADIERLGTAYAAFETVYARNDLTACIDTDVAFHR